MTWRRLGPRVGSRNVHKTLTFIIKIKYLLFGLPVSPIYWVSFSLSLTISVLSLGRQKDSSYTRIGSKIRCKLSDVFGLPRYVTVLPNSQTKWKIRLFGLTIKRTYNRLQCSGEPVSVFRNHQCRVIVVLVRQPNIDKEYGGSGCPCCVTPTSAYVRGFFLTQRSFLVTCILWVTKISFVYVRTRNTLSNEVGRCNEGRLC